MIVVLCTTGSMRTAWMVRVVLANGTKLYWWKMHVTSKCIVISITILRGIMIPKSVARYTRYRQKLVSQYYDSITQHCPTACTEFKCNCTNWLKLSYILVFCVWTNSFYISIFRHFNLGVLELRLVVSWQFSNEFIITQTKWLLACWKSDCYVHRWQCYNSMMTVALLIAYIVINCTSSKSIFDTITPNTFVMWTLCATLQHMHVA